MIKITGSGSGFISQKHGSADPDPDPPKNVMDPEHWLVEINILLYSILFYQVYLQRKHPAGYGVSHQFEL